MTKVIFALLLAFGIGAACRLFDIPLPAPPTLLGVSLILAITLGYIATDRFVASRARATVVEQDKDAAWKTD